MSQRYVLQPAHIPDIIRCKNCIHRGMKLECPMVIVELFYDDYDGWDEVVHDKTTDMGYCHSGEMEI